MARHLHLTRSQLARTVVGGSLRDDGECGGHLCRRSPPRWLKIALPAGCDKATLERITRLSCRISSLVRSALSGCLGSPQPSNEFLDLR